MALNGPLLLLLRLLNGERILRSLLVGVPVRLLARRNSPLADGTPGLQPFIDMLPFRVLLWPFVLLWLLLLLLWLLCCLDLPYP